MKKAVLLLMFLVLILASCSKINITGQAVREVEAKDSYLISFGDILGFNGNYKCSFYNLDNSVLYVSSGNYRIDFNDGNHVLSSRTNDGGLCVSSWEDKSDTLLNNCITKEQYDSLWAKLGLNNVNPGDAQIPSYNTQVECEEYYEEIGFNPPKNLKLVDFSNLDSSTSSVVLKMVAD